MNILVWDRLIRCFHWFVAASFLINYFIIEDGNIHEWLGYGVAFALMARFIWGFVGSQHARFSDFFPTPKRVVHYIKGMIKGEAQHTIGHNPLGSIMVLLMMIGLTGITLTGWFMTLDMFWAVPWPEEVHNLLANVVMTLVAVHVSAVLFYDVILKQGLIRAMITGRKTLSDK